MYIKSLFFAIHKIPLNKKKKETYTFLKSRRQSVMVWPTIFSKLHLFSILARCDTQPGLHDSSPKLYGNEHFS